MEETFALDCVIASAVTTGTVMLIVG